MHNDDDDDGAPGYPELWQPLLDVDPEPPDVELAPTHAEPLGTILGPDGRPAAIVYPPRLPFGFHPPGARP